ncbi:meiosis-specific protein ASY2-like [Brassica napus]|uniref:meiosis-specific protein ASY2-like n=1 Tax=Brassica napus TaxID=3708 RepID=UPI000BBED3CB|nr:meiosis-specific protein ASY2-like [Brassica napus]
MSSGSRLSKEQKGKAVATETSPVRVVDSTLPSDFEAIHREAMMDTTNMDTSQRVLVAESARLIREERANVESVAQDCARDGRGGAHDTEISPPDFVPCCYHPEGIFEDLPTLAPGLLRPPAVEGQSWENVEATRLTPSSVKILLRECAGVGVTFLIPTKTQRPWSPPVGFQCVYESYFQNETRLWFPIPRLITSYVRRRDAAISQFLNGSFRLLVALLVMAAEIDVSMNVRSFDELAYLKSMGEGLYLIQMRPNYNVIVGIPIGRTTGGVFISTSSRMIDLPDTAAYPEEFIENARALTLLPQESWDNITVERIRRVIDRISRKDWGSDLLPLVTGRKCRFSLFTRAEQRKITTAREMKALPDLIAIIGKRLSASSSDVPSRTPDGVDRWESPPAVIRTTPVPDPVGSEPSRESFVPEVDESAQTRKKGKKRPAPDASITMVQGGSSEIAAEVRQDEPPQKKKKKDKKKKPAEKDPVPSVGAENRKLVVHEESSRGNGALTDDGLSSFPIVPLERERREPSVDRGSDGRDHSKTPEGRREAEVSQSITATTPRPTPSAPGGSSTRKKGPVNFPDHVEFKYDGETPLAYTPEDCAELVRQIRGGAKDMRSVKDLIFKDAYVDAARTKVLVTFCLFNASGPDAQSLFTQSDGSMNYVVELYNTALKETISKLKNAERLVRVKDSALNRKTSEFKAVIEKAEAEQSRLLAGKKVQKAKFTEKFGELKGKFKTAGEKIRVLEREKASLEEEKAAWEKEKAATALRHLNEINRLRDS